MSQFSNLDHFKNLEEEVRSVYLLNDPGILKLLCATIIAQRLKSDPVWVFIVGPSSGGKTELLNCLTKVQEVYPLSSLTPHTFLSGQKKQGRDTSLLLRIKQAVFTMKDFTTILTMNQEARDEILGQMREIYDGDYYKDFGTGERVSWKGKVSMLAGVTPIIYLKRDIYASMGERFVMYQLIQPGRIEVAERAMANIPNIREKREHLKDLFKQFLDQDLKIDYSITPQLPEKVNDELRRLAELTTRARSPIEREWRSPTKEITFAGEPEMPTRFATQLSTLGQAMMALNEGPLTGMDLNILYKIALDSIDKRRRLVLRELVGHTRAETSVMALKLGYPTNTIGRWCEDLTVLGLITRTKDKNKNEWELKPEYKDLLKNFEDVVVLDEALSDPQEDVIIEADDHRTQKSIQLAVDYVGEEIPTIDNNEVIIE